MDRFIAEYVRDNNAVILRHIVSCMNFNFFGFKQNPTACSVLDNSDNNSPVVPLNFPQACPYPLFLLHCRLLAQSVEIESE